MQELFVIGPKGSTERVAIFLWRFRKTHSGETATTTWRKLIPPISDSGFPLQSLTQQLSIPTPSTSRTNHYDPLDTDLTPTTAGSTLSNTDQSLMAWEGHEWDNGIQQDPRSSHDLGINFQNDCFSTQGSYYPDPPELQQNTSSMTYANDGQVDSAFDSQVTPFPSQASIDHAIQANADNSLPSELLSRRIQEFADQTNSDVVNHDLTGKSTYEDDSQRHIEDMEFNSQDTTGFLQSHSEDYSFHNVNDPHLFTDFNGGHIHLDFNHEQTTGPHSLESLHVQANFQHSQDIGFPHSPHQNQLPSTFGTPELLGTTAQSSTPILATTHANDVGENQASPELCADAHTINRHHDPDICADGDLLIHLAKVSREQELQHQRRQQLSQASQPPTHDLHTDSTHVDMNLQTQQLLVRIETEVVKSHITTFATTTVPTVPSNVSASTSPSLGAVNLNSIFDASSSTTHHPILQNFAERGTWSIPGMGTLPDGLFEDVGANSHSGSVGVEVARAMTGAFVDTTPTAGRLSTGEESEHGRVIGEIEGEESECEGDQVEEEGVDVRCEEARMDMELDGV